MNTMTTWSPMPINGVGIRMSASGHAFVPAARIAAPAMGAFSEATYVATAAVKPQGHMSLVADGEVRLQVRTKGETTGSDAWRPPTT